MNILKRPMFFAAVICSIIAALSIYEIRLFYVVIAVAISTLLILIFSKKYKYIAVLFAVLIFCISLFCELFSVKETKSLNNQSVEGKFIVVSEPDEYDGVITLTVKTADNNFLSRSSKYLLFCNEDYKLKIGDIVDATLTIDAINKYSKYRISNYSNGIYATANVKYLDKTGEKDFLYHSAGNIRATVKSVISDHFDGDSAGLLLALTTGERTMLSDEFLHNVKTTGISHVIVVSGMHLSIIMSAVLWILDRFFYNKYIRSILSVTVVLLISVACGFTVSISRAGLMFVIGGLAPAFNRENDSLNSLMSAITAMLIVTPFAVVNVSFLLSVLSTLAIIWIVPFYYNAIVDRYNITSKLLKAILSTSLCSISAIICTLPVTIKIFSYMSIVSPITNLLVTYPVTILLVLNVVAVIISALPVVGVIGYPLLWIAKICSQIIVFIVNGIAKLPITVAVLPKASFWWSLLIVAVVIGFMYFYDFKLKKKRSDLNANSV